jgi:hypothetical protein
MGTTRVTPGVIDIPNLSTVLVSDNTEGGINVTKANSNSPTITTPTISGVLTISAGTALLPSIIQTGDPNTGIYFPSVDHISISTAGTERVQFDSAGHIGIGCVPSGSYILEVVGAIGTTGQLTSTIVTGTAPFSVLSTTPVSNLSIGGSAATLTTARGIYGNNFNGSAAITNIIASTYGGTGNGFTKFTGPTTAERTFTLPDSNQTLLYTGGALGTPSSGVLTSCTFPTLNQNTSGSSASCTGNSLTATTANALATGNNYQVNSLGVGTAGSGTAGEIRATNNITAYYSDERLKGNIVPIDDALYRVMQISGVTFTSNELAAVYGYTDIKEQVGVIAQQVEKVLPQIVVRAPFDIGKDEFGNEYSISGQNYLTVQYEKLIPLLIEAIKALSIKVSILEHRQ